AVYTPSKRMRIMTSALSHTSSGSFLVDSSKVTSQSVIPVPVLEGPPALAQPDWGHLCDDDNSMEGMSMSQLKEYAKRMKGDLRNAKQQISARDGIIEASHATLVVQNLFVQKQSQALNAKENKKKTSRAKLSMEGRGRHLTGEEWMRKPTEAVHAREEEAADKKKRAEDREVAKATKARPAVEWEKMKEDHLKLVEDWTTECERQTAAGVKKKNLPKKPTQPLKPKAPVVTPVADNSDGAESSSEEE
ncbi:hypothetical protein GGX14DRAFT_345295, partial [Mycena pura]